MDVSQFPQLLGDAARAIAGPTATAVAANSVDPNQPPISRMASTLAAPVYTLGNIVSGATRGAITGAATLGQQVLQGVAPATAVAPAASAPAAQVAPAASPAVTPLGQKAVTPPTNVTPAPLPAGWHQIPGITDTPENQHALALAASTTPQGYAGQRSLSVASQGVGGNQGDPLASAIGQVPLFQLPGVLTALSAAKGQNASPEAVLTKMAVDSHAQTSAALDAQQTQAKNQADLNQIAAQRKELNTQTNNDLIKILFAGKGLPQMQATQ